MGSLMMISLTKASIGLLRYILINYLPIAPSPIAPPESEAQISSRSGFWSANITLIIPWCPNLCDAILTVHKSWK
ncbi:hypothetical protein QUB63_00240 [Microcoleus sp. ARI1-B5]|uniref:hypothetical protein n=1 Tax=unclassified Microcoleus TaxID=2642155 RepID=UPI002FCF73F4